MNISSSLTKNYEMNNLPDPAKTKPISSASSRGTPAPHKADSPFKAEKQANCKKFKKSQKLQIFSWKVLAKAF
jgi:hypothetical protein